jgi:hypothetical protein
MIELSLNEPRLMFLALPTGIEDSLRTIRNVDP